VVYVSTEGAFHHCNCLCRPLWFTSLGLGATFAAADIKGVMYCLQPSNVPRWVANMADMDRHSRADGSGHEASVNHMNTMWHRDVAIPAAMLVQTMRQLSRWGDSVSCSIFCCWGACVCCFPTVVAQHDIHTEGGISCLIAVFVLPALVAAAPAHVGTQCNQLLSQLNDISLLVSQ
jgi:hypothetical protein